MIQVDMAYDLIRGGKRGDSVPHLLNAIALLTVAATRPSLAAGSPSSTDPPRDLSGPAEPRGDAIWVRFPATNGGLDPETASRVVHLWHASAELIDRLSATAARSQSLASASGRLLGAGPPLHWGDLSPL